jgi:hypothetical protein
MTSAFYLHIVLYNRERTASGTSDVKRGSVCALLGYLRCGGLCFAGSVS